MLICFSVTSHTFLFLFLNWLQKVTIFSKCLVHGSFFRNLKFCLGTLFDKFICLLKWQMFHTLEFFFIQIFNYWKVDYRKSCTKELTDLVILNLRSKVVKHLPITLIKSHRTTIFLLQIFRTPFFTFIKGSQWSLWLTLIHVWYCNALAVLEIRSWMMIIPIRRGPIRCKYRWNNWILSCTKGFRNMSDWDCLWML